MKANGQSIVQIFTNKHYAVPQYQRYYSWDQKESIQIVNDITSILKNVKDNGEKNLHHFMGNIVTKDSGKTYEIIDGQQRLTTLILIAKAIIDSWKEDLEDKIIEKLEGIFVSDKNIVKLTLTNAEEDNKTFRQILTDNFSNVKKTSRLYKNYLSLKTELKKIKDSPNISKDDLDKFVEIFLSLDFVVINLGKHDDNAQNVFESLNSKGKELNAIDLIKNYIFMNLSDIKAQNELYSQYWSVIERNLTSDEMENFIRFYSILKRKSFNRKYLGTDAKEVYEYFKVSFPRLKNKEDITKLLEDMWNWHFVYLCVITNKKNASKVKEIIKDTENQRAYETIINVCEKLLTRGTSDLMPFIYLYVSKAFIDKKINKNELEVLIKNFENYYARWFICSNRGNLLDPLIDFANGFDSSFDKYSADPKQRWKIAYDIKNIAETSESIQFNFFNDEQVKFHLVNSNKILTENKIIPLLEMVEREVTKQDIIFDEKSVNKEHIMPKSYEGALKEGWPSAIKASDEKAYNSTRTLFGNFILIDKRLNKEMDTKPFSVKKEMLSHPDKFVEIKKGKPPLYKTKMMDEFLSFCFKNNIEEWNEKSIKLWCSNYLSEKVIAYISSDSFRG